MSLQCNIANNQPINHVTAYNNSRTKIDKFQGFCCENCTYFFRNGDMRASNSRIRKEQKKGRKRPPHRDYFFNFPTLWEDEFDVMDTIELDYIESFQNRDS